MVKFRAVVIGLGAMGKNHARVLDSMKEVDLIGVIDPALTKESNPDIPYKVLKLEELSGMNIDFAVVAVPTAFHEEVVMHLVASGINYLVEKPIANTLQSALNLCDITEKAGLLGAVGHIERYNSALQQAKKRIEDGQLGEIYQIATRRQGPFPSRISDVGVILDLMSHDIDLTSWVANSRYLDITGKSIIRSGRTTEDMVCAVGELQKGQIVNHIVNWLSPLKERQVIITGAKGAFLVNTLTSELIFYENPGQILTHRELAHFRGVAIGEIINYAFDKPEPLLMELKCFVDQLAGKSQNTVSLRDGIHVLEVAEKLKLGLQF